MSKRICRGFSLVELLVVIGIIVLLLLILLPAISNMRKSARSTQCLANVQQWGHSYQMYLSVHHGRPLDDNFAKAFWEVLSPYNSNVKESLFCPEARAVKGKSPDPGPGQWTVVRGAAHTSWSTSGLGKDGEGSYAFNWNVGAAINGRPEPTTFFQYPAKESERIPVFVDCIYPEVMPALTAPIPSDLEDPGMSSGITTCCIDRHRMAINVSFLDGHAERVPLPGLWKLKWRPDYKPSDVRVPGA